MVEAVSALAKKLGLKSGKRAVVLNAPDGVLALFEPLPAGATVSAKATRTHGDLVLVFAKDSGELTAWLPRAVAAGEPGGLLWIAYPKGGRKVGTDLNRDILWAELEPHGLTGVTLVAVDGTWSAMRFRPADQVGT